VTTNQLRQLLALSLSLTHSHPPTPRTNPGVPRPSQKIAFTAFSFQFPQHFFFACPEGYAHANEIFIRFTLFEKKKKVLNEE
jgi:hypothetical protein